MESRVLISDFIVFHDWMTFRNLAWAIYDSQYENENFHANFGSK